jgi:hypothetical protein
VDEELSGRMEKSTYFHGYLESGGKLQPCLRRIRRGPRGSDEDALVRDFFVVTFHRRSGDEMAALLKAIHILPHPDAAVSDGVGYKAGDPRSFPLMATDYDPFPRDELQFPWPGMDDTFRLDCQYVPHWSIYQADAVTIADLILTAGQVVRVACHGNSTGLTFGKNTIVTAQDFQRAFDERRKLGHRVARELIFCACSTGEKVDGRSLAQEIANRTGIRVWGFSTTGYVSNPVLVDMGKGSWEAWRKGVRGAFVRLSEDYLFGRISGGQLATRWLDEMGRARVIV